MSEETKREFLDRAEALFAERGFEGVSLADISGALGLTKQALLHHFKSKAGLYGQVLARIADGLDAQHAAALAQSDDPAEQLRVRLTQLYDTAVFEPDWIRVLMRELLDNNRRAPSAGVWYLRPFLDSLTDLVERLPNWPKDAAREDAFAAVYALIGAVNYVLVSGPTLSGIYGEAGGEARLAALRQRLDVMVDRFVRDPR
jgi:AcrR family transcriptional regulator